MIDPYSGREQTKAKHFILKRYLQALAFKVLTFSDLTYVDGFSGPWETRTKDFADSSFMIAVSVLRDAQRRIVSSGKPLRRVRCFFVESNPHAFSQLRDAVAPLHDPGAGFEVRTHCGLFEDAVTEIQAFISTSFPLIFIDPTGWAGYPFEKIKPLFIRPKCEVLINFMYEFVNRFSYSDDQDIIASMNPILGGPGWQQRLDPSLPRGAAVENLFRETLQSIGQFKFVVSTRIDKATSERPHFFITYGTKSADGLKAFRDIEYGALREHVRSRASAKQKQREEKSGTVDLFASHDAEMREATIDQIVEEQKRTASDELVSVLPESGMLFKHVVEMVLQKYVLRETNVKDICVTLARMGVIQNTWGSGNRKPTDDSLIKGNPD